LDAISHGLLFVSIVSFIEHRLKWQTQSIRQTAREIWNKIWMTA